MVFFRKARLQVWTLGKCGPSGEEPSDAAPQPAKQGKKIDMETPEKMRAPSNLVKDTVIPQ